MNDNDTSGSTLTSVELENAVAEWPVLQLTIPHVSHATHDDINRLMTSGGFASHSELLEALVILAAEQPVMWDWAVGRQKRQAELRRNS